jgi:hypothetical protein
MEGLARHAVVALTNDGRPRCNTSIAGKQCAIVGVQYVMQLEGTRHRQRSTAGRAQPLAPYDNRSKRQAQLLDGSPDITTNWRTSM